MSVPGERELQRLADLHQPADLGRRGPYEPTGLRTLGKWVSGLIVAGVGLGVVALVTLVSAIAANANYEVLGTRTAAVAADNADATYLMWSGWLLLWIRLGGVVFVIWLYRVYRQTAAVTAYPFSWSPGWAIGAWFVPGFNLYLPYRLMADIAHSVTGAKRATAGTWWGLLVVGSVLSVLSGVILEDPEPSVGAYYTLSALGEVVFVGSGIAGIFLVRRLTAAVADASERAARPVTQAQPRPTAGDYLQPPP